MVPESAISYSQGKPVVKLLNAENKVLRQLVELGQQCPGSLEQRPPFLGELQRPRAALEQTQVEAALQFRNPAGQGRLRTSSGTRGPAETSVPGDKIEISEGDQIHVFHQ